MIDIKYNDFIGMYTNVFPENFCQFLIEEYEKLNRSGLCTNRQQAEGVPKRLKDGEFAFLNLINHSLKPFEGRPIDEILFDGIQTCFDDYAEEFDGLKDTDLRCSTLKMQKTNPGAGYHVWHHEQQNGPSSNRGLVYSIYLNTLGENCAGETEFLYQKLRVPPKENSLIIWPAGFTHTHRGNVVHGNEPKYIVTGWFLYE